MLSSIRYIAGLAGLLTTFNVVNGEIPQPSSCVGKVTKFPNCDNVNAILKKCSDLSKQETIDCFCTQELLNAYEGCKGEIRQCALSYDFDSSIDDEINNWYEACSPYLPNDITTPEVAAPTRILEGDTCNSYIESCAHLSQSITSCSSAFTKPAELTSCRCQTDLLSLASYCNIDGPVDCIGTTAVVSNLWEFQHCAAATEVLQTSKNTGPITTKAESSGGGGGSGPTKSLTFGPDSTSTTTKSGATSFVYSSPSWKSLLALSLGVWYLLC